MSRAVKGVGLPRLLVRGYVSSHRVTGSGWVGFEDLPVEDTMTTKVSYFWGVSLVKVSNCFIKNVLERGIVASHLRQRVMFAKYPASSYNSDEGRR